MPKIIAIIKAFKDTCQRRGWKTSDREDWIGIDNVYHNFLYMKDVPPSTFKKIVTSHKCVVPEGASYHVVDAQYTAWLFSETPSTSIMKTVIENPNFSKRVAVYDLSPVLEGRNACVKLNNTESPAFLEFENFLREKWNVRFQKLRTPVTDNMTITELA